MYYSNFFPTCVLHYLIQWRLFIIVLGLEKFIADLYTVFVFFTTDVLDFSCCNLKSAQQIVEKQKWEKN